MSLKVYRSCYCIWFLKNIQRIDPTTLLGNKVAKQLTLVSDGVGLTVEIRVILNKLL